MFLLSRLRALVLVAIAALILSGCGSGDDPAPASTSASGTPGAFPARVVHKFGTTTVPSAPKRIAVVGLTEQDTVLALGEKPLATTEWYGEQPFAVWPWARKALGDTKPTVLTNEDGFDFEAIAGLAPDLIIGTNSGMKDADYAKLSQIAPTVAAGRGSTDYFSPWDEQVVLIAQSLGKEAEGRRLVADVRARYAKVAAEHPEFRGKTVSFVQNAFSGGELYAYPDGLNTEFLTYLGLRINPEITRQSKVRGEQVGVSAERLDTVEADVLLVATEKPSDIEGLEKVPTFGRLDVVSQNRTVYTDGTLAGAIYFITPLSLPYVLDRLVPQLESALAGEAPRRIVDTSAEDPADASDPTTTDATTTAPATTTEATTATTPGE